MSRVSFTEFKDCRARLQRLSDQTTMHAWVGTLSSSELNLRFDEPFQGTPGERHLFQLAGLESDAYFIATLVEVGFPQQEMLAFGSTAKVLHVGYQQARFELVSQIQFRKSQQVPRKVLADVKAAFIAQGASHEAIVADASATGVGLLSFTEVVQGDVIEVQLESRTFGESFLAEVRYCRPERKLPGAFRIGLLFRDNDRVAFSSWRKLIDPF